MHDFDECLKESSDKIIGDKPIGRCSNWKHENSGNQDSDTCTMEYACSDSILSKVILCKRQLTGNNN